MKTNRNRINEESINMIINEFSYTNYYIRLCRVFMDLIMN